MKRVSFIVIALLLIAYSALCEPMLSADGSHILALDASGSVWAWGSNHRGESVPGKTEKNILSPEIVFENAVFVAAGQQFSMAIDKNGNLYAWGDNREKQIFSSSDEKVLSPALLFQNVLYADACDTLCACVTKDGQCFVWGNGADAVLISENAVKCAVGTDFALVYTDDQKVYEYQAGESKLMLENVKEISASGESRYALAEDGSLCAWGAAASDGRLLMSGSTKYVSAPEKVYEGSDILSLHAGLTLSGFLTNANELSLWGTLYSYAAALDEEGNTQAVLIDGTLLSYGNKPIRLYENVLDIAIGDAFIALLFESGDVYTWGSNDFGQLGNGNYTQTVLLEAEDDEGYEVEIISSADSVFPQIPLTIR